MQGFSLHHFFFVLPNKDEPIRTTIEHPNQYSTVCIFMHQNKNQKQTIKYIYLKEKITFAGVFKDCIIIHQY